MGLSAESRVTCRSHAAVVIVLVKNPPPPNKKTFLLKHDNTFVAHLVLAWAPVFASSVPTKVLFAKESCFRRHVVIVVPVKTRPLPFPPPKKKWF